MTNYAADGFTSSDVLNGAKPILSGNAWLVAGEKFPSRNTKRGVLRPLEELETSHSSGGVSHVVLSVGGNDIRVILRDMTKLSSVVDKLQENYRKIVEKILSIGNETTDKDKPKIKLILVLQYQVCLQQETEGYGVYSAVS